MLIKLKMCTHFMVWLPGLRFSEYEILLACPKIFLFGSSWYNICTWVFLKGGFWCCWEWTILALQCAMPILNYHGTDRWYAQKDFCIDPHVAGCLENVRDISTRYTVRHHLLSWLQHTATVSRAWFDHTFFEQISKYIQIELTLKPPSNQVSTPLGPLEFGGGACWHRLKRKSMKHTRFPAFTMACTCLFQHPLAGTVEVERGCAGNPNP